MTVRLADRLRLVDGPVNLLGYPADGTPFAPGGKARTKQALDRLGPVLAERQEMLFAAGQTGDPRRVLLVLQGTDTSGKDGTIKHVVGQVGPSAVRITAFKKPTPAEAAHHFLWRIRRALPPAGLIGVFNRSHYEDVLSPRVHGVIDEPAWQRRIAEINAFEAELAEAGTVIVKCFLHIGYAEQRQRLLDRLADPTKQWKFNPADLAERARWSEYQACYADVLEHTDTAAAPWYVVPSERKWYRNWAVGQLLADALAELRLSYPGPGYDVAEMRARLQPPH
ncbi:MAG TPA: PPK2 family polyphosphate kinase [Jatrophihabitans sp.]|nr:PPK2 family polyphosphate kinase [Jatrophihabitans sp.]